ncbi:MAG: hypothetical protein AAB581_00840 [Patescibacteria group bacterium]
MPDANVVLTPLTYDPSGPLLVIQFIFWTASAFFFFHGAYLVYKLGIVKDAKTWSLEMLRRKAPIRTDEFVAQWQVIRERMATMREADYKLAIIEADKLFDELLTKMTYRGNDMADRLKQLTPVQLPSIQGVWDAHKVRNLLAHDITYHLNFSDAQRVIGNYERAFRELGILDGSEE